MEFKKVLEGLKKENIEALESVIDAYSNLVFRVVYSILNDRENSEECINDVFMKVWSCSKDFEGDSNKFKNWICTIAKYTAIDRLRKDKKHMENISIENREFECNENIEIGVINREEIKKVQKEIEKMKSIDKEIFIRRFYYNESIKDISKVVKMSENAVSLRILRGRKVISMALKGAVYNG